MSPFQSVFFIHFRKIIGSLICREILFRLVSLIPKAPSDNLFYFSVM